LHRVDGRVGGPQPAQAGDWKMAAERGAWSVEHERGGVGSGLHTRVLRHDWWWGGGGGTRVERLKTGELARRTDRF
jgi:hypothetical protein